MSSVTMELTKFQNLKERYHKKEIHSITLDSLERTFAFKEKEFLYSASLMIVNDGRRMIQPTIPASTNGWGRGEYNHPYLNPY